MIQAGVIAGSPKGLIVYVYGGATTVANGSYTQQGFYDGHPLYVSLDGLRMMWWQDDTGYYHISDFGNYDKSQSYYYDKSVAANPWDGTQWTRGEWGTDPVPTVSLTPEPLVPTAMQITGAGAPSDAQTPLVGMVNGKPRYVYDNGLGDVTEFRWTDQYEGNGTSGLEWILVKNGRLMWHSTEDVDYPHQITTWTIGPNGEAPAPTVTAVY